MLVDAAPVNTIERILSRRSLIRGHSRIAAVWSFVATLLLLMLLFDLNLLLGIVVDRGRLDVVLPPAEFQPFEDLTRLTLPKAPRRNDAGAEDPQKQGESVRFLYEEYGILPAVWQTRNLWWGKVVAYLFRKIGWLRSNVLGLVWLLATGSLLLLCRNFCLRQVRLNAHRIAIDAVSATRRNLHRQVLRLGPEDIDGAGHEIATGLFTVEVDVLRRNLYELVSRYFRFPLELLGLSIVLLCLNWVLALQWIAPSVLAILWADSVLQAAIRKQRLAEDRIRDEEQILLSSFQNARLTRGMGIEQSEHEQFQKHLDRYQSKLMSSVRAMDVVKHPQFKIAISCIGLLAFLLFLVGQNLLASPDSTSNSGMTASQALTFIVSVSLALPGILALRTLGSVRHELKLAAEKVHRYLEQLPSVSQAVGAKFLQPMSSTLHFENVTYLTPGGRKILDGVDFKLQAGKTFAIVSLDPLEARAVALMLPRFIEAQAGRVMFDGEDIAWGTLESLRAETVYVSADDPPIDGTVFENIQGRQSDVTLAQVTEAAKMTRAHNFIVKLFNGYETVLTSYGNSLDLGQRFRLNLARAVVRDPALLIIEEPTAAMDDDTKTLLIDAYDRICRDRTVVFLPSRMSTVRRTDQILVLHEGKVAAIGPQSKLVTQSPVYRHWEYLNFNEFRRDLTDVHA
jgi:ABC-type multidrug transport system fused ATPase/permease subunit